MKLWKKILVGSMFIVSLFGSVSIPTTANASNYTNGHDSFCGTASGYSNVDLFEKDRIYNASETTETGRTYHCYYLRADWQNAINFAFQLFTIFGALVIACLFSILIVLIIK